MRKINKLNNCTIFNKFVQDDLEDYSLESYETLNVRYKNSGKLSPVSINLDAIREKYIDSLFGEKEVIANVWYPVFVWDDKYVNNKLLGKESSVQNANFNLKSGRLGIEEFISFEPQFKNWKINNGNVKFSSDWILNRSRFPYYLEYGILFWVKRSYPDNQIPNFDMRLLYTLDDLSSFPKYSRLSTNASYNNIPLYNQTLIKLDDSTLYRVNADDSFFNGFQPSVRFANIDFKPESIVRLSDLGENPKFYLFSKEGANENDILARDTRSTLWISDGDFFSYFENETDKYYSHENKIFSKSYISPCLYSTYRQIYHILTLDRPKLMDKGLDLRTSRILKKLSYALSSSPLMSELGIGFLNHPSARNYLQQEIINNTDLGIQDINSEIKALSTILVNLHRFLNVDATEKITRLDNKLSQKTLNNNLINSQSQLFKKILSKYGGYLNITEDCVVGYKHKLKYGDNVQIEQGQFNYCKKELTGETVYNNHAIKLGQLKAETNINETRSDISLSKIGKDPKNIPLSDFARNTFPVLPFVIQMNDSSNVSDQYKINPDTTLGFPGWSSTYIYYTENVPFVKVGNNETKIQFRIIDNEDKVFKDIKDNTIQRIFFDETEKISVLWEKVYGKCLRFTDTNKTPQKIGVEDNPLFNFERYTTSTQLDPFVFVYATGEYKLKCTISTSSGVFVKTKTFYVVVGPQKVGDQIVPFFGKYADLDEPDPASITDYAGSNPDGTAKVELTLTPPTDENNPILKYDGQTINVNQDQIKVISPAMTDVAFNSIGMFWPRRTFLSYANDTLATELGNYSLEGEDKFFFGGFGENEIFQNSDSELILEYKPNNTKIAIFKFGLNNIRNGNKDGVCDQCLSFYRPIVTTESTTAPPTTGSIEDSKGIVVIRDRKQIRNIRNHKGPSGSLSLISFKYDNGVIKRGDTVEFIYPQVSSKYAPKIKPYGGYSPSIIQNKLGQYPNGPKVVQSGTNIFFEEYPEVTGYRLDYAPDPYVDSGSSQITFDYPKSEMKVCYQKAATLETIPTSDPNKQKYIEFKKGVFHPSSGWINYDSENYDNVKNLSSVLKFNPGARDTFSFVGPGLYGLSSSFNLNSENENKPSIYQSAIELNIAEHVQWDPLIADCESDKLTELKEAKRRENQLNKEYSDQLEENFQSMKHGYRYLEGGFFKLSEIARSNRENQSCDEFGFSSFSNRSCGSEKYDFANQFTYSFPVTGPSVSITPENIAAGTFRDPRVNDFAIQDIEVKLNFLNYVNTKNLIVWLDVFFSHEELDSLEGNEDTAGPPIKASNEFVNQNLPSSLYGLLNSRYNGFPNISNENIKSSLSNVELVEYLDKLVYMNSKDGSPHRIYLLNQDHIQNNQYNFSIKFTDHASDSSCLFDENFCNNLGLNTDQNIVQNNYEIQPTISASGYTDRQCSTFKNVIRTNQLNIVNNKFAKFKNRILFQKPAPEREKGPCQYDPTYDSSTRFVLNIAVLDEYDDMNIYDNISNLNLLSNYETGNVKYTSSDIYSSLCSWELILHVSDTKKPIPTSLNGINNYGSSNSLSLIEYGKEPQYPGYNFIADLKDIKYLLPSVNVNAPTPYIYVPNITCDFADPIDRPRTTMLSPPDFPEWAIIAIYTQIAGLAAAAATGGMIGFLGGLTSVSTGYIDIITYLRSNKIYQEAVDKLRNFYVPKYESYPFGSPEKILLNISKDKVFWYKLEASIFRYDNTPSLQHNKYKYIRLNRNVLPIFSNWSYNLVKNIRNLIDDSFIITTELDCSRNTDEEISQKITYNQIYQINFPDNCKERTGLYIKTRTKQIVPEEEIGSAEPTEQTEPTEPPANEEIQVDKLYRISQDNSDKQIPLFPESVLHSSRFIQYNNAVRGESSTSLFNKSLQDNMKNNKVVIIESKIPFYIFNVNNNIECYSSLTDKKILTTQITSKSLIFKDNKYYTVLGVKDDIGSKSYLSLKDKDCVLLFKPETTAKLDYPINIWGFEKSKILPNVPEETYSTNSVGSIGYGSYQVDQSILDSVPNINNIDTLYEILNNSENDKLKYNKLFMIDSTGLITESSGPVAGFSLNLSDTKDVFLNSGFKTFKNSKTTDQELSNLLDSLEYTVSNIKSKETQLMIIKSKGLEQNNVTINQPTNNSGDTAAGQQTGEEQEEDDQEEEEAETQQEEQSLPNYGDMSIDQDFVSTTSMNQLTQKEVDTLYFRLKFLEGTIIQQQEDEAATPSEDQDSATTEDSPDNSPPTNYLPITDDLIGNPLETDKIIENGTIKNLLDHYNSLPEDNFNCLNRFTTDNSKCYKKRTKQALSNCYQERDEIIKLLKYQANVTIDQNNKEKYVAKKDPGILPRITVALKEYETDKNSSKLRSTKAIKIEYSDNSSNYYWINIDPKQSCTLASELNPRVLIKTKYTCRYAYSDSLTFPVNNNVCPRFATNTQGLIDTINNFLGTNDDEKIDSGGNEFTFSIPEDRIKKQKEAIETNNPGEISKWENITIQRSFTINNDSDIASSIGGIFIPFQDIIVDAVETYAVAVPNVKNTDLDTLGNFLNDDGSADGVAIGQKFSRVGLMDYTGNRDRSPSRVYNIFNLDQTETLYVQFRKIPRMLKGVDYRNTVNRYGVSGSTFRPIVGDLPPLEVATDSSLNNMFYYWECLQRRPWGEWKYTTLPDLYKLLNEMEFRGFFGSTDYIEYKTNSLESLYPWEIIPYEYDNAEK